MESEKESSVSPLPDILFHSFEGVHNLNRNTSVNRSFIKIFFLRLRQANGAQQDLFIETALSSGSLHCDQSEIELKHKNSGIILFTTNNQRLPESDPLNIPTPVGQQLSRSNTEVQWLRNEFDHAQSHHK